MNTLKTKARARKIRALALSALLVAAFVIPQATLAVDGGGAADPALNKDSHSGLVPESTPQADGAAETAPADKTGDNTPADETGDGIPADETGDNTSVGKTGDGIPTDNTGDNTPADKTGDNTPADKTGDNTPNKDSHSGLVPESTPQADGATETAPANKETSSPPPLNPVTSTILAFTPLEDEVRYQRCEAPSLPETVEATIESNETVAVPVSWKADGYAPGDTGLHVFIATPGTGYSVSDGVELPRVTAFITEPEPTGLVGLFSFGRVQGLGTAESPLEITNADQLAEIAALVNKGTSEAPNALEYFVFGVRADTRKIYLKLMNDIDLANYGKDVAFNGGKGWIPIGHNSDGYYSAAFKGVFDGGGHKVTGLYINDPDRSNAGLFGYVYGTGTANRPVIKNLGVDGAVSGRGATGGVVGMLYTAVMENCYMAGAVSGTGNIIGGVAGYVFSSSAVTSCYATGAVSGTGSNVGGVAGYVQANSRMENCYATGAVNGSGSVGGVVGNTNSSVTYCAALNPSVTTTDTTNPGRVIGTFTTPTLSGNAAFSGMTLKNSGGGVTPTPDDPSGKDGVGVDKAALQNLHTAPGFPASLTRDPWVYNASDENANKLPGLPGPDGTGRAIGMPPHLLHGFKGAGTEPDPWQISTAAELALLADYVNDGTAPYSSAGACYKLMNDIDLSAYGAGNTGFNGGKGWIPIGDNHTLDENSRFRGVFDGGGHKATGLYISDAATSCAGIFGYVYGTGAANKAVVKNLGVDGEVSGVSFVGGVVGAAYDTSTVKDCYATGEVSGTGNYVGGVVGVAFTSTVEGCYTTGEVSGVRFVGGVVGAADRTATVKDCYATGEVSGTECYVGGVVGVAFTATVEGCYATGAVSGGTVGDAGGVVGVALTATVEGCYATGAVSVSGTEGDAGGVVGYASGGRVASCAALNPSVTVNTNTTDLGRVVGFFEDGAILSGNAAFSGMALKDSNGDVTPNPGANLKDGASVDKAALQNLHTAPDFPASLTQPPWVYTDGDEDADKLPGLPGPDGTGQAIDMPPHLRGGAAYDFVGSGTGGDPWRISTAADLARLARLVNSNTAPYSSAGACYKLMNDIDLSAYGAGFNGGRGWIPIGDNSSFRGVFDGDSHKVTGLYISNAAISYAGLFGYVYGTDASNKAVVKDLGVDGAVSGNRNVGGVAGYIVRYSTIENCYMAGAASGTGNYVGGVVGFVYNNSTVEGCYATGVVSGTVGYVGGVVGSADNTSTVEDCYATGAVSGDDIIGGVVGAAFAYSTVKDCYATGAVSGSQSVGGVAGYVYDYSTMESCYATGAVSGTTIYVGGVAGYVGNSTVTSCAALNIGVNTSATTDAGLGRAVGYLIGTNNTLTGLTAFNETPVIYSTTPKAITEGAGDATPAGKDGLGYTEGGVEADGAMAGPGFMDPVFWTGVMGWGGDAWDIAADRLPILKNVVNPGRQTGDFGIYDSGQHLEHSVVSHGAISGSGIAAAPYLYTYDGSARLNAADKKGYQVKFGDKVLAQDKEYVFSYAYTTAGGVADRTNVTGYNIEATAKGMMNYTGATTRPGIFRIVPKPLYLTDAAFTVSKEYDGTPALTATGILLKDPADGVIGDDEVELEVSGGVAKGASVGFYPDLLSASYSLKGAKGGNYSLGAAPATMSAVITPRVLDVARTVTKVYDGSPSFPEEVFALYAPDRKVGDDDVELEVGAFTVESPDVGEYGADGAPYAMSAMDVALGLFGKGVAGVKTYTLLGGDAGNYSEGAPAVAAVITPRSLEGASVVVGGSHTYDGKPQKPSDVTVVLDGKTLTAGKDYTLSYGPNIEAGRAVVIATGTGNYKDTALGTFIIAEAGGGGNGGSGGSGNSGNESGGDSDSNGNGGNDNGNGVDGDNNSGGDAAGTGDRMDTGLWLILVAASASALVILLALLRRRLVLDD